jgi:hypothetical protein
MLLGFGAAGEGGGGCERGALTRRLVSGTDHGHGHLAKMEHSYKHPGGAITAIHYWKNLIDNSCNKGHKFK